MAEKVGSIPEQVTYVFSGQQRVKTRWDMDDYSEGTIIKEITVTPAYPVATGNEKRLESARKWARTPIFGRTRGRLQEVIRDNKPFSLQICALEIRDRGGRAYKVVDEDGYYFDLREDVLLEALFSEGCKKDGHLNGKYLWCVIGSQTKLVRNGSALHDEMKQANEISKAKPIKKSELVAGGIYCGKNQNDRRVFIGSVTDGEKQALLWFDVYEFEKHKVTKINELYRYKLTKDSSMVRKLGDVKINQNEMLKAVEKAAQKRLEDSKKSVDKEKNNLNLKKIYEEGYERDKKEYSPLLSLALVGA